MDANTAREAIDYLLGSPFEKEESAAEKGEGRGKAVPAYNLSRYSFLPLLAKEARNA
jgi:hypothetical protein